MKQEKCFHFHNQLTAKDLWGFSLYHSNRGHLGVFNLLFTLAAVFLLLTKWSEFTAGYRILLVVCALLFSVWQPFQLYLKAGKQAKTKAVQEPMEMTVSKEGMIIRQLDQEITVQWEQVARIERVNEMVIIYTDRIHAYLLPGRVIGEQREALFELFREVLPKARLKRI